MIDWVAALALVALTFILVRAYYTRQIEDLRCEINFLQDQLSFRDNL